MKTKAASEEDKMRSKEGTLQLPRMPGDSPHQRQKSLPSFKSPQAVREGGPDEDQGRDASKPTSRKRRRKKDLHRKFEAAATNGKEKVDLEINSGIHKIRLVITSPMKKQAARIDSAGEDKKEGRDLTVGRRLLAQRGVQSMEAESPAEHTCN